MPRNPNRQAQRSQRTRESIVAAAVAVFTLKGYAAASMDDVRLATGCSKGGLYHHFSSKPALLAAAVARLGAEGALTAGPALARPSARLILDIWAEAARDPALQAQLAPWYDATRGSVADLIDIGTMLEAITRAGADEAAEREEAAA